MFIKKVLSAVFALGLAFTVYAEWSPEKTAAFLKEVGKTMDPEGKKKDIKTFTVVMSLYYPKEGLKIQQTVVYKSDKKWKLIQKIPHQEITYYFSNDKCVSVDTLAGVSPVDDATLEMQKMHIKNARYMFDSPEHDEKVSIADKLEEYNGKKYIAVTYFFPAQKLPPQKCLIDPNTKLPAYVLWKDASINQEMKLVYQDYKKIHGILFATKRIISSNSVQYECKCEKITVNENYPDSMFEYKDN